jgi:hypothetical protein
LSREKIILTHFKTSFKIGWIVRERDLQNRSHPGQREVKEIALLKIREYRF